MAEEAGDRAIRSRVFGDIIGALYRTPDQEGWELLPDLFERLTEEDRMRNIRNIPGRPPHPVVVQYLSTLLGSRPVEAKDFISRPNRLDFAAAAAEALARLNAGKSLGLLFRYWDNPEVREASITLASRYAHVDSTAKIVEMIRKRDYRAGAELRLPSLRLRAANLKSLMDCRMIPTWKCGANVPRHAVKCLCRPPMPYCSSLHAILRQSCGPKQLRPWHAVLHRPSPGRSARPCATVKLW
jgi:hypothetical protein